MSVKTFILSSIAFLTASAAHGITPETPDSLRVNPSRPDTLGVPALYPELPQTTGISTSPSIQRLDSRFAEEMKERSVAPLFSTRGLYVPAPGYASIASLPGLEIAASGASESLPGLAGIERGRLSATAALGPVTLSAWGGRREIRIFRRSADHLRLRRLNQLPHIAPAEPYGLRQLFHRTTRNESRNRRHDVDDHHRRLHEL